MKNGFLISLCATAALASIAGCSSGDDGGGGGADSSITLENNSQTAIKEVQVAQPGQTDFADNLLDADLLPGDSVTVLVFCDTYDLQLTDDTDTTCIVPNIDVCGQDATVSITEDDLDACADGFFKMKHPNGFQLHMGKPKLSQGTVTVPKK